MTVDGSALAPIIRSGERGNPLGEPSLRLTTHDILRAREVATRLGIMRAGRIVHLIDPAPADLGELEQLYLKAMDHDLVE